jgi:hypothetical protein
MRLGIGINSILQLKKLLQAQGQGCREFLPSQNLASRSEVHRAHATHDRVPLLSEVGAPCIEQHAKGKVERARSEHTPEELVRNILLPTA